MAEGLVAFFYEIFFQQCSAMEQEIPKRNIVDQLHTNTLKYILFPAEVQCFT